MSISISGFSRACGGLEGDEICKIKCIRDVGYELGREVLRETLTLNMYNPASPPTREQLSLG